MIEDDRDENAPRDHVAPDKGAADTGPRAERQYEGQCHCGAVRFSVRSDLASPSACNCSHCRRVGWIMQSVPASAFTLLSGADVLTPYRFNTETIDHSFCSICGIESFARGSDGRGNALVMININCLEPEVRVDPAGITHWDGANF